MADPKDDWRQRCEELEKSLENSRRELAEVTAQMDHFRQAAEQAGRGRLRETDQLSKLVEERRRAEKALDAERGQLLSIFDSIDEAVYVSDPKTFEILYANQRMRDLFGDVEGKKYYQVFQNVEDPGTLCTNDHIFGENQGRTHIWEFENSLNDRWYRCINRAILWPNGKMVRYEMAIDITEDKQLEEELQLRQKMESVGRLAGGIAHDFNNILMGIMGGVSILDESELADAAPATRDLLHQIQQACNRARDLNNQLLTFSQGGAPVKERASLTDLIRETVAFVLRGSNVKAKYDIPDDLWAADIDRVQISQVIQNIVINADQAMPQGGAIAVSALNADLDGTENVPLGEGRYVRIVVKDTGVGIPREHLSEIFDPYYTTKVTGHGLGLATSYSIVENHQGHISADSHAGNGTTLTFHLPAADETPVDSVVSDPGLTQRGTGAVLVMDDEDIVLEVARGSLELLGYDFVGARDGITAVRRYREAMEAGTPFVAVVMDLTVPGGMGGAETLPLLQELDPDVRAIVSSGYSNNPAMSEYESLGFKGVPKKPYDVPQLGGVLSRVIGSP